MNPNPQFTPNQIHTLAAIYRLLFTLAEKEATKKGLPMARPLANQPRPVQALEIAHHE